MLLSISAARVRVYEQVTGQWKRLFGDGEAIASLPPMLALNA
jgi:nitric oxide reductase large subunit